MKEIIRMNQLAGIITEGQARKMMQILNEGQGQQDRYVSDADEGTYIEIDQVPTPKMQAQIAKAANKKFGVDPEKIEFGENPHTGEYSVFIPFAGDYSNMMGVLKKFGIKEPPYTSPHLR